MTTDTPRRYCTITTIANGWLVDTRKNDSRFATEDPEENTYVFTSPNALGDFIAEWFRPKPENDFRVPEAKPISELDLRPGERIEMANP